MSHRGSPPPEFGDFYDAEYQSDRDSVLSDTGTTWPSFALRPRPGSRRLVFSERTYPTVCDAVELSYPESNLFIGRPLRKRSTLIYTAQSTVSLQVFSRSKLAIPDFPSTKIASTAQSTSTCDKDVATKVHVEDLWHWHGSTGQDIDNLSNVDFALLVIKRSHNAAGIAPSWGDNNTGSTSKQPKYKYTVGDFESFPPGTPYQDVDDARLAFNVFKSIREGIIEKHVVDSVKSAIYHNASPQCRVQLAHLANQGGVSVKVADEILDARGDLTTAFTYVRIFRAVIEDPEVETSHTWQE